MVDIRDRKCKRRKRVSRRLSALSSSERLRFFFYASNKYIYAQVINKSGATLTSLSTSSLKGMKVKNNKEAAAKLAEEISLTLLKKGMKDFYLDRGERLYHGKVKVFADTLRKKGLNL